MEAANPFVYGEIVTAGRVRRPRGRARPPAPRPRRRPEGLPHLAAALRQVVAHPRRDAEPRRASASSPSRSPSPRPAPTSRFLEAYARALVAADTPGEPAPPVGRASCCRPSGPSCASSAARPPARRASPLAFPAGADRARHRPARRRGLRAARPHRRRPPPAHGHRPRRVPGHRRVRRRQRRARPPRRRAGPAQPSATSSPARSRR